MKPFNENLSEITSLMEKIDTPLVELRDILDDYLLEDDNMNEILETLNLLHYQINNIRK